jgi:hypothetical protein
MFGLEGTLRKNLVSKIMREDLGYTFAKPQLRIRQAIREDVV